MKAFYNTSIECDICTQLQAELEQMFSTYTLFQPIYVPRDDELATVQLPVIEPRELDGMEIVSTAESSKGSTACHTCGGMRCLANAADGSACHED